MGGGRVQAQGPGRELPPGVHGRAASGRAATRRSRSRARRSSPCASGTCSRTPRAHVRLPLRAPAGRRIPGARLRVRLPPDDLATTIDASGQAPLLFEPRHGVQLLRLHGRARPRHRGAVRPVARRLLRGTILGPLDMFDTAFGADRPRPDGRALHARPRPRRPLGPGGTACAAMLSGGGGLVSPRPTITTSRRCSSPAARRCSHPYAPLHRSQPPAGRRRAEGRRAADDLETQNDGMRLGLGFSRRAEPGPTKIAALAGEPPGAGSPAPPSASPPGPPGVQFFTQITPSSAYPLRSQCASSSTGDDGLMKAKLVGVPGSHPCVASS